MDFMIVKKKMANFAAQMEKNSIIRHDTVVIGSMTAASVIAYAAMMSARKVLIDSGQKSLPLRHSHHRYTIDSPGGPVTLTVPLDHDTTAMAVPMREVKISEHGAWREKHWGALFSAYGKSPYFDYLADELHRIIVDGRQRFLLDLNMQLHRCIIEFMALPINDEVAEYNMQSADSKAVDMRQRIGTKRGDNYPVAIVPYYQQWQHRHEFIPSLSIIDLACNLGREGIKICTKMLKQNVNT